MVAVLQCFAVVEKVAAQVVGSWDLNANGNWSTPGNWVGDLVPLAAGDTANLTWNISANRTITLDVAVTLGHLTIYDDEPSAGASGSSYILSGTNTLTFDVDGNTATLGEASLTFGNGVDINGNTNTISVPIALADTLNIIMQDMSVRQGNVISGIISTAPGGAVAGQVAIRITNPTQTNGPSYLWSELFLRGANTFTGQVVVESGVLRLETTNRTLGAAGAGNETYVTGAGRVDLGGLDFKQSASVAEIFRLNGHGVYNVGVLVNNSFSTGQAYVNHVILDGDSTINSQRRIDFRRVDGGGAFATLELNGHALTKFGAGDLALVDTTLLGGGTINVYEGELRIESSSQTSTNNTDISGLTINLTYNPNPWDGQNPLNGTRTGSDVYSNTTLIDDLNGNSVTESRLEFYQQNFTHSGVTFNVNRGVIERNGRTTTVGEYFTTTLDETSVINFVGGGVRDNFFSIAGGSNAYNSGTGSYDAPGSLLILGELDNTSPGNEGTGFTKRGNRELRLENANTAFDGTVVVKQNTGRYLTPGFNTSNGALESQYASLALSGVQGGLNKAAEILVERHGSVWLDNTSANHNDRLNDNGLFSMKNGFLVLSTNGVADNTENLGNIQSLQGTNKIFIDTRAGAGRADISLESLTVATGSALKIAMVDSTDTWGTGAGDQRIALNQVDPAQLVGNVTGTTDRAVLLGVFGSIAPGAGGATVVRPLTGLEAGQARSNASARLLTVENVGGVNYVRQLHDSEYVHDGTAQAGSNWLLTGSLGTFGNKNNALNVAQDTTINSLTIADASGDNSNGEYLRIATDAVLTIESGMINFANYGAGNDVNTEASIRGGRLDMSGRQAVINSGSFWEDLNRNDANYYNYLTGNSSYLRSSIINADGLVKTGRNNLYLETWNQFLAGSKAYATDESSLVVRHSNALDGIAEVVIAGNGNFLLQGGVNVIGVDVRVTALDGDRVVLRSESHHNTWAGDVIFDPVDASGSTEFGRQRITANSNATLTVYGDIYIDSAANAAISDSDLWNDPFRFSTDGSGSGIVNLRGTVKDTENGPVDRPVNSRGDTVTTIDRNHSLSFQLAGADDVNLNVFNQWQATGRLDLRQGYFRVLYDPTSGVDGSGFLTDTTRSRILANDYSTRAALGADGSGAQTYHSHLVLTRDGQVFNYPYLYSYNDNRHGTQTIAGENRTGTVHLGSVDNSVNFSLQFANQGGDRDIRLLQVRGGTLAFNGRFDDEGTSVNSSVSIVGPGSVIVRGNAIGASDIERWNFIAGDARWENHLGNNRFAVSTAVSTWGGGTLTLAADTSARSHSLTGNIYLLDGASGIEAQNNITLTLGSSTAVLTRRTGATMTFAETGSGAINFSAASGVPATDGARFDSWAVYGAGLNTVTDWAARSGTTGVQAFAGYTNDALAAGAHTNLTQDAQVNADTSTATLRFADGVDVDIANGSLLTLEQGGILIGSDITGDVSISGGSITSAWGDGSGRELVLHHHGAGKATISSTITNDGANKVNVVHSGPGTTVLAAENNTYTGDTYVNSGTLQISSDGQLGSVDGSITRLVFLNAGSGHTSNLTNASLVFNTGTLPGTAATGTFNTNGSAQVSSIALTNGGSGYSQGVWVQPETAASGESYAGIWAIMNSGNLHLDGGTLAVTSDVILNGARTIFLGANGGTLSVAEGSTLTINGLITSDASHVTADNGFANADHVGGSTQRYTDRNPDMGDLIISGGGTVVLTGNPDGGGTRAYLAPTIGGITWVNDGFLRISMAGSASGEWLGTNRSFLDGTIIGANGTLDLAATSNGDIYEWFTFEGTGYKGAGTIRMTGTARTYDFVGQLNIDEDIYISNRNNSSLYLGESTGTFYGDGDITYSGSGGEFRIYTNAPDWTGHLLLGGGVTRLYGNGKVLGMTEMVMTRNAYLGLGNGGTGENQFDSRLNDNLNIFADGNVRLRMEATGGVFSGIERVGTLTVQGGLAAVEIDLGSDLLSGAPRLTGDYAGWHFKEIVRNEGTSVQFRNFDPGTTFADEAFNDTALADRAVVRVDVAPTLIGGDGTNGNRGIVQGFFGGTRPVWVDDNGITQRYNEDYTSNRFMTVATNALGEHYLRPLLDSEYKSVSHGDAAQTTSIAWEDQGIEADQNLRIVGVTSDLGIGQGEFTSRRNSILTIGTKDNHCDPYVVNSLTFASESYVSGSASGRGNYTALYIGENAELTITSGMIQAVNTGIQNMSGAGQNTGVNMDIRSAINGGRVNFNNQEAHFYVGGIWTHYNTSAAPNGYESTDFDNNYLFMNSRIVGATNLVKTGGAALFLSARNEYTGNTYINQGAIYARHDQALGLGDRVELSGSGSFVIGWGVHIKDVDVYVGKMAGNHLGLAIENGSSWGGNVIIDNVDSSGVAGPYARNFRTRVYSASTNLGTVYGDIMGGPTPMTGGGLRSDARLFSTYTGGAGIFDIRGHVRDSASGAVSGPVTDDNQSQVLRMEIVANNNESNVQLWNQHDAAGRIRLLRGYLRYNGEGNFYTDAAASAVNSNPLNPMVGLQMGGRNIAESNDGEGAANLGFFLANAGTAFNLKSWEVGVETYDPVNAQGSDNYGRGNTTGNSTLGGENLSGEVVFGTGEGSITFTQSTRQTSAYNRDLRLYAAEDGTVTMKVSLVDGGNLVNSSITKIGSGTVNLHGSSAGASTVERVNVLGGTLVLGNYGEHLSRRVGVGASLLLSGGNLIMDGSEASFTETLGALTVDQGGGTIAVLGNGAGVAGTLEIGGASITRLSGGVLHLQSAGGGTIRFTQPGMASVARLGSYATFGVNSDSQPFATDWASTNASGQVVAFSGYAVDTFGDGLHTDVAAAQVLGGATVTESLRFNSSAAGITGDGQSLTVEDGGILITSNHTGGTFIGAGVGLTTGDAAVDLIIHNYGTGEATLAGNISGDHGVVFSGSGVTVLTGTNTYTGTTHVVNGAVVSVSDMTKLGDVANLTDASRFEMNRGTIRYTGSTSSPIITSNFVLGGGNATFDVTDLDGRLIFRGLADNQFSSVTNNVISTYGANNPNNGGLKLVGEGTVQFGDRSAGTTGTDDYLGVRNSYTGLTILGDGSRALTVAIQSQARDDNYITPFGSTDSWTDGTIVRNNVTLEFAAKRGDGNHDGQFRLREWFQIGEQAGDQVTFYGSTQRQPTLDGFINVIGDLTFETQGAQYTDGGGTGNSEFLINPNEGGLYGSGDIIKKGDGNVRFYMSLHSWTGDLHVEDGYLGIQTNSSTFFDPTGKIYMGDATGTQTTAARIRVEGRYVGNSTTALDGPDFDFVMNREIIVNDNLKQEVQISAGYLSNSGTVQFAKNINLGNNNSNVVKFYYEDTTPLDPALVGYRQHVVFDVLGQLSGNNRLVIEGNEGGGINDDNDLLFTVWLRGDNSAYTGTIYIGNDQGTSIDGDDTSILRLGHAKAIGTNEIRFRNSGLLQLAGMDRTFTQNLLYEGLIGESAKIQNASGVETTATFHSLVNNEDPLAYQDIGVGLSDGVADVRFGGGSAKLHVVKTGSGTTVFGASTGGGAVADAFSDYTGDTLIQEGRLAAASNNSFSPNSRFTVSNGAVLAFKSPTSGTVGSDSTIGSLVGTAGATVDIEAGTMRVGGDHTRDADFSGEIIGAGSLYKVGTGVQRFSGNNSFDATFFGVLEGTLVLGSANAAGSEFNDEIALGGPNSSELGPLDARIELLLDGTAGEINPSLYLSEFGADVGEYLFEGVTFVGTRQTTGTYGVLGDIEAYHNFFVVANGTSTFRASGEVFGDARITKVGAGMLELRSANDYLAIGDTGPGSAINGSTVVRHGSIAVFNDFALDVGQVELGDRHQALGVNADLATTGNLIGAKDTATFDGASNGAGGAGNGAFIGVKAEVDGVTLTQADVGKRILVKDQLENPEQNGVYVVVSVDPSCGRMNLVRAADFDESGEMQYGTSIVVSGGATQTGSAYFMSSNDVTSVNADETSPVYWEAEILNPDVSLLLAAENLQVDNHIDINDTNGTGTTTIGGTFTSGYGVFTGDVILQHLVNVDNLKELVVTSASDDDGGVVFEGVIDEDASGDVLSIRKTGSGTVTFVNASNGYAGKTTVAEGTLAVEADGTLGDSTWLEVHQGATFDTTFSSSGGYTFNGAVSGNGTLRTDAAADFVVGGDGVAGSIRPGMSSDPADPAKAGDMFGTLTVDGNLVLSGDSTGMDRLVLQLGASGAADHNDMANFFVHLGAGTFDSYVQGQADNYDAMTSGNHDRLVVNGELVLESGGYVVVDNGAGYGLQFGDILNLLDWTSLSDAGFNYGAVNDLRGGFLIGDLELPELSGGLLYDTSLFASHGILMVVPEPGRAVLVFGGLVVLALGRRRRVCRA